MTLPLHELNPQSNSTLLSRARDRATQGMVGCMNVLTCLQKSPEQPLKGGVVSWKKTQRLPGSKSAVARSSLRDDRHLGRDRDPAVPVQRRSPRGAPGPPEEPCGLDVETPDCQVTWAARPIRRAGEDRRRGELAACNEYGSPSALRVALAGRSALRSWVRTVTAPLHSLDHREDSPANARRRFRPDCNELRQVPGALTRSVQLVIRQSALGRETAKLPSRAVHAAHSRNHPF